MRWTLLLTVALLFGLAVPPTRAAEPGKKETAGRAAVAAELLAFADWCAENDAKAAATEALAAARALHPAAPTLGETENAIEAASEAPDEPALAKARKTHGAKIANAFTKLAGAKHAEADQPRFDDYRLSALRWDPAPARVKKAASWVKKQKDSDRAGFLLGRARRSVAAGAGKDDTKARAPLDALAVSMAKKGPLLLGSIDHDLIGWVWLPKSWKKGKTYPVLIGVDGAGANHKGYGAKSAGARGSRPVIVLAPATLSNTNSLSRKNYRYYPKTLLDAHGPVQERLEFDGAGVDALLRDIATLFGGEDKVFLTGFSGGGQYTYYKLLQDPAHVRGAVPCCGNFGGGGKQNAPGADTATGGPPVLLLTGANDKHRDFTHGNKDSPGIEPQTDHAEKTLKELGYKHVERRMLKVGHSPLHTEVWKFVDTVLGKK